MASVTAKDIPGEQKMFTQIWNMYKKYYVPERDDDYWEQLKCELMKIIDTYKSDLCTSMCLAVERNISDRYKKMRKEGLL